MAGYSSPIAIGVDLGATNINAALVDHAGELLGNVHHARTPSEEAPDAVFDAIAALCQVVCDANDVSMQQVESIGLATPGALDLARDTVTFAPNLGWSRVVPREALAERLPIKACAVENDVNAALFAEAVLGAARDSTNALAVWIGTGIGGAVLRNGRLDVGGFGSAGEIGQFPTPGVTPHPDRPQDAWIEQHASRRAIELAMRQAGSDLPEQISAEYIAELYSNEDEAAVTAVDDAARLLAPVIATACTFLSISTVIVGGGLAEHLPGAWIDRLTESVRAFTHPPALADRIRVVRTALGSSAGLRGAALLSLEYTAAR